MGHRVYITEDEWLAEQRVKFMTYFKEHAEKEILGYDYLADIHTDQPWCAPWTWTKDYDLSKPKDWFEMIKKNLENVTDEEFYYHTGNDFENDQMEFEF